MSTSAPNALLDTLIDDAAIFPPGNAPLADAVTAHRLHTGSWYGSLVGRFVVSDARLPELTQLLEQDDTYDSGHPLTCALVVAGGAGAIELALTWAQRCDRLALHGVEIALRDEDDLARNARRVATALQTSLPDDVHVYVELPRDREGPSWGDGADAVAESGYRLKFRTGGETADDHPDAVELAEALAGALDREVAFKCTAGMHHAVRNTAPDTGFEQHGFLNVALATRALLDGADRDAVVRVLAERDGSAVAAACSDMDSDSAARVRRWFTSFGSCSINDPVRDLGELGLLTRAADAEARR